MNRNMNIELDIHQKDEIGVLADALRKMLFSLKEKAESIYLLAEGDLTANIRKVSEKDSLGITLIQMKNKLNQLLSQIVVAVD